MPAHIHLSVKEPDVANEYYTDELNLDNDPLLTAHFKKYPQKNRGGSGVVSLRRKDGLQVTEHDIILGLNIPDYPKTMAAEMQPATLVRVHTNLINLVSGYQRSLIPGNIPARAQIETCPRSISMQSILCSKKSFRNFITDC
ncbi:hypothetical protein [Niabella aquatica]